MEPYIRATHTKRFVVEDSITKVTSDGEPHEMMTMIAGLSGLAAAVVILAVLVSLVACKKNNRNIQKQCKNCPHTENNHKIPIRQRQSDASDLSSRSSMSTTYTRTTSIEDGVMTDDVETRPRLSSEISVISTGNLEGNLNSAFMGSELNLSGSLQKKKKKTHWSDEVEQQQLNLKSTTIDIERY